MQARSEFLYRITVIVLSFCAFYLYVFGVPSPEMSKTEADFSAYGYSYIKVRDVTTNKLTYMVADKTVRHCCGDMQQLAKLTLSGNDAARAYIQKQWEHELDGYNLQPNFVKCLKSESEAEANRVKKVEFFKKLGHRVVVIPIKQDMAAACP